MGEGWETYSTIDTLAETAFADVLEGRGDGVWPDEFVDVEVATTRHGVLVWNLVLNDQHLQHNISLNESARGIEARPT